MRVIVEQLGEWRLAGETEVLGENLPQRHFVHHKIPHEQTRGRTSGRRGGTPATNSLSYGAAKWVYLYPSTQPLMQKKTNRGKKTILVTGHEGPYGCATSRLTYFLQTIGSQMAVRLSALRAGRPLPTRKIPGTHFC
jgi:hypothetical protein